MNDAGSSSMNVIRFRWRQTALFISAIGVLVLYNEWLVYYFVLLQCQWPTLNVETNDFTVNDDDGTAISPLHIMALADTHLLGTREGHWFDQLRRLVVMRNIYVFILVGFHRDEKKRVCLILLTDRLVPPATDRLLIMYGILLQHLCLCYSSCVSQ